jgi:hypothetical protein
MTALPEAFVPKKPDVGYVVAEVMRRSQELTLFPELFAVFSRYSRKAGINDVRLHPRLKEAVHTVSTSKGLCYDDIMSAVIGVLVFLEESERGEFDLINDFLYFFESTSLEVPQRAVFKKLVTQSKCYCLAVGVNWDKESMLAEAKNMGLPFIVFEANARAIEGKLTGNK